MGGGCLFFASQKEYNRKYQHKKSRILSKIGQHKNEKIKKKLKALKIAGFCSLGMIQIYTGSYQQQTVIETACFLGTYEIPRDYMIRSARLYHSQNTFRFPEKIIMKLYIV